MVGSRSAGVNAWAREKAIGDFVPLSAGIGRDIMEENYLPAGRKENVRPLAVVVQARRPHHKGLVMIRVNHRDGVLV
jgi:hypothetical protein